MSEQLPDEADVCIIGSGATGSVAAYVLAQAGVRVVALDAGPIWDTEEYIPDELGGQGFKNDLGPKWNREPVAWHDPRTGKSHITTGLPMMNGVGGSAIHYAGHAWRFHPTDFRLKSQTIERYGKEALPTDSTVEDWPVGYAELEPYYELVEKAIGVSGKAGVLLREGCDHPVIEPGGNPFEGPRRSEYPMPPLRMHRLGKKIWDAAERLGYHPFMGPTAINSVSYDGRPATNYCGFCLGYGCRIQAKGSPNNNVLPKALWTGNLEVVPDANVVWLELDEDASTPERGRLRAVHYIKDGEKHVIRAKNFMLASYTFENIRLLLHSRSALAPRGLANSRGLVGKHFMIHRFDSLAVWLEDEFTNRFGNHGQRVVIDDLNSDNFDHSGLGFIAGAQIFVPNEMHLIQDLSFVPPDVPFWGAAYKSYVKDYWNRLGYLMTVLEVLPYTHNYVELDESRKDQYGIPLIRAQVSMGENEDRMLAFVFDKMTELGYEAGASRCKPLPNLSVPSQHDAGGTRMGDDPETSVVDRWGLAHDVDNLFVLGPSVFPTSAGHNPSLTAQALAWRSAEHLLSRL